jgi:2-dehydro-3-deoxyphosphogluconate aldolase/(4S)-4-hydroxy-2-oxoglutarate aldolase
VIRTLHEAYPDLLVGAGTVLTVDHADKAIDAGAQFLVAPGFNPRVVKRSLGRGVLMVPGCITPSEMEAAMELELDTVKFFPAEQAGGIPFIRAVSAPYRGLHFIPTGGVNIRNLGEYLSFDRILACGGSWMVKDDLLREGRWDEVTRLCREAADVVVMARRQ